MQGSIHVSSAFGLINSDMYAPWGSIRRRDFGAVLLYDVWLLRKLEMWADVPTLCKYQSIYPGMVEAMSRKTKNLSAGVSSNRSREPERHASAPERLADESPNLLNSQSSHGRWVTQSSWTGVGPSPCTSLRRIHFIVYQANPE